MALFTLSEFASYLQRSLSAEDAATAQLMLELTTDKITAALRGVAITDPPQAGLKAIALKVAARGMGNPRGVVSEATGGVSVTYQSAVPHGIYLTAQEIEDLTDAAGRPNAYTLRLAHRTERPILAGRAGAYDVEAGF